MTVNMANHFPMLALLRYTLPSICMMVFTSLYSIVDGLFVSNFAGTTAFAAVNLIMPAIMILSTVGFMIGSGGSAIVAKTRGEGDDALANQRFSLLVAFAAVMGVILMAVGIVFMEPIAYTLGARDQMLADATLYGTIIMFSLPFFVLQYSFQSFFVTAGKPMLGFWVIVGAGVANMVLDAVLVGLLGWGLVGAAVATNISEVLGGIIPVFYFLSKKNTALIRLTKFKVRFGIIGKACVNGSSEMVANVAMSVVSMLYNLQLLHYVGENGVAAYGVIMYTGMLFGAIFMGYAMGSSPLLSYQYGAQNRREMRSLLFKSLGFVGVGGVLMFLAGQALAYPVSAIFVGYDQELLDFTANAYRLYALCFLLMGFSIYGSAFFTALNNGLVSAVISFLRTLVFETSAVILLPLIWGINGIWLSVTVAELAAVIVTATFMIALRNRYGYGKPKKVEAKEG